eukprot:15249071-Heterocapsa_arctica.AAC.1
MEIGGMKRVDIKHDVIEFPELSLKDIAEIIDMPKDAKEQFNLLEGGQLKTRTSTTTGNSRS